jgi:hypothetical protein
MLRWNKLECLSMICIFIGELGRILLLPYKVFLTFPANVGLGWNTLPVWNLLAYFFPELQWRRKKSFIELIIEVMPDTNIFVF